MLPMIVLRRLDCVLEPTKDKVLEAKEEFEQSGVTGQALEKARSFGRLVVCWRNLKC
jgi:type I restriction enzyme M protein